jgi:DNA-binding transcriptional ArsR family regulator
MGEERDPYFAFADATRRDILDQLREEGPATAGAIAARFPEITREAVSRHLRILREAGLLTSTQRGREQWYALDSARLQQLYAAFFGRFVELAESSLSALKERVERSP